MEGTHWRYVGVTRLMPRYRDALRLIENVIDEAVARDSATGKSGFGIQRLISALLSYSEKQSALLFIEVAAAHTKDNAKEKRTAARFSLCAFYSFVAALLKE